MTTPSTVNQSNATISNTPTLLGNVVAGSLIMNNSSVDTIYVSPYTNVSPSTGLRIGPLGSLTWTVTSPLWAVTDNTDPVNVTISSSASNPSDPLSVAEALVTQGIPSAAIIDNLGYYSVGGVPGGSSPTIVISNVNKYSSGIMILNSSNVSIYPKVTQLIGTYTLSTVQPSSSVYFFDMLGDSLNIAQIASGAPKVSFQLYGTNRSYSTITSGMTNSYQLSTTGGSPWTFNRVDSNTTVNGLSYVIWNVITLPPNPSYTATLTNNYGTLFNQTDFRYTAMSSTGSLSAKELMSVTGIESYSLYSTAIPFTSTVTIIKA